MQINHTVKQYLQIVQYLQNSIAILKVLGYLQILFYGMIYEDIILVMLKLQLFGEQADAIALIESLAHNFAFFYSDATSCIVSEDFDSDSEN